MGVSSSISISMAAATRQLILLLTIAIYLSVDHVSGTSLDSVKAAPLGEVLSRSIREARKPKNGKKKNKGKKKRPANDKKSRRQRRRKLKTLKSKKDKKGRKPRRNNKEKPKTMKKKQIELRPERNADCPKKLADLGSFFGNQIRNVLRQTNRAEKIHGAKMKSKMEKKDAFVDSAAAVGRSPCNGEVSGRESGLEETLMACEADIEAACPAQNEDDLEMITACKTAAENFGTAFAAIKDSDAPCDEDFTELDGFMDEVKACKDFAKEYDEAQKELAKACKEAFMGCRQAQRDVIGELDECNSNASTVAPTCPPPEPCPECPTDAPTEEPTEAPTTTPGPIMEP